MVLTEPEEPEEENSNPEEMDLPETEDSVVMDCGMDLEVYLWHYKNEVDEFYENLEFINCQQYKIEKMKEKADRIKEEFVQNATIIKERQLGLKSLQLILEKNLNNKSVVSSNIKQISEKLAKVYGNSYGHFGCSEFLFLMLNEFEEWSFDLEENTPAETLHKQQMEFWKDYYKNVRVKEQAELDALKEERWQRRREQALERALAPPVKISGKKLMPRSPPPKKVVKKVETKKQE
ncbi:cilia- and flagella-associated protein 100-like [Megalobrama amblycephala]|uniref:cilia- and flagella-associated protein 100-like n=1 Tax=Megalobrama amblycephala TaxID=75352 RepID=UPI0020144E59|nr:cilia- and flagella-associated protein 100-like [Megalobrama amblycephala]